MQELLHFRSGVLNIAGTSIFTHGGKFALLLLFVRSVCFGATEAHPGERLFPFLQVASVFLTAAIL